jgi:hypothetical protein
MQFQMPKLADHQPIANLVPARSRRCQFCRALRCNTTTLQKTAPFHQALMLKSVFIFPWSPHE